MIIMMEIIIGGVVVIVAGVVNAVRIDNLKHKHANEVKQLEQQVKQLNQDKFQLNSKLIQATTETVKEGLNVVKLLLERPAPVKVEETVADNNE